MTVKVEVTVTWRLLGGTLMDTWRGEILKYDLGDASGFDEEKWRGVMREEMSFKEVIDGVLAMKAPPRRRADIAKKIDAILVFTIIVSRVVGRLS